ncbi:MAG: Y-family DNA polymerase [Muribaculaceae bacterium]|nr:Y-family DNA polymerase [Muribaculaceae bacterium]
MIGLADCNNFFCSCERLFRPDLARRPVVVLSNNDGCIVARSNEAKALGLKMGDPYFQVRPLLQQYDVAVFSSNYRLYSDLSDRVMTTLARFVPRLDIYSIDEAFLHLSGMGEADSLGDYGHRIVDTVGRATGIPISLGIAPTRTLAKMASRFAKKYPGYKGVCVMDTDDKRRIALSLFDIADIWGIGRRHEALLRRYGINTAADLAARSGDWVRRMLTVTGLRTWKELHGEPCISVDALPHKQSIRISRSFPDRGLSRLADLEEAIANFAASCAWKLRRQSTVCSLLRVYAMTSRFRTDLPSNFIHETTRMLVPTNSLSELVDASVRLLRRAWHRSGEGFMYKKAGVMVEEISRDNAVQGNLFDTVNRHRAESLMRSINDINNAMGRDVVRTAVQGYSKKWHLTADNLSPQYTTDIRQVPVFRCV